jgi:hypothetical protein
LPRGLEQSLGLRIECSPPTRLRARPSRHSPACGPSLFPSLAQERSVRASVSARRSGRSVPVRSGAMAPIARGAESPPPPESLCPCINRTLSREIRRFGRATAFRVGGFPSAGAGVADLSGARGHRTREPRWGDGGAASCERRGAPARIAPSGRGRRSVRPQRLGRRKAAYRPPRHRHTMPSRSDRKGPAVHPRGNTSGGLRVFGAAAEGRPRGDVAGQGGGDHRAGGSQVDVARPGAAREVAVDRGDRHLVARA